MKRELAEKLLAQIMEWSDAEKASERAALDVFAAYKYDEYQQFTPGRRFLESLALWLRQFEKVEDRRAAYDFVRRRLVFISDAEMNHLVELAFPTLVRPRLISKAAEEANLEPFRIKAVMQTLEYRKLLRQTLVLGLSDGARTDRFRRANPLNISNEQIWHAYDVSNLKAEDLGTELTKDLRKILGEEPEASDAKFRTVVLLDDFTASGTSYLREDDEGGWTGKIPKTIRMLEQRDGLGALIADEGVQIIIVIYVAAAQAIEHINGLLPKTTFNKGQIEFKVVHELNEETRLDASRDTKIFSLVEAEESFDTNADDEHGKVGGTSVRYGYANCRLPIVLSHNTPNNSIFLLWADEVHKIQGLFPRVSRHRKFE